MEQERQNRGQGDILLLLSELRRKRVRPVVVEDEWATFLAGLSRGDDNLQVTKGCMESDRLASKCQQSTRHTAWKCLIHTILLVS